MAYNRIAVRMFYMENEGDLSVCMIRELFSYVAMVFHFFMCFTMHYCLVICAVHKHRKKKIK